MRVLAKTVEVTHENKSATLTAGLTENEVKRLFPEYRAKGVMPKGSWKTVKEPQDESK